MASTQVLAEFAATLLHKMSPPASPADVIVALSALEPIRVAVPDADMVRRAVEARAQYGVHFYDGMIIAAAYYLEHPDEAEDIGEALAGNQCRCTGYTRIFESVKAAGVWDEC